MLIKFVKERIIFGVLKQCLAIDLFRKHHGQAGFSYAQRTFNYNMMMDSSDFISSLTYIYYLFFRCLGKRRIINFVFNFNLFGPFGKKVNISVWTSLFPLTLGYLFVKKAVLDILDWY